MKNLLRGGAFLLAIIAAFAFTSPLEVDGTEFGYDSVEDKWYDATGATEGVEYLCNQSSEHCLFDQMDDDPENAIPNKPGTFVNISLTPEP
ncbi:hypothetical protein [Echinicola shivajiensis]|uniref:hypothetical protein n=1 Tax=Echinicola shivajiensis TaxID=1035916 RepID=UPI001BFCC524|nr:hypothetical protein [Echinicola shivajiensis]